MEIEIREYLNTEPVRQLCAILRKRIKDHRKKNDSVLGEVEFRLNQGAIREAKALLKMLTPVEKEKQTDELKVFLNDRFMGY